MVQIGFKHYNTIKEVLSYPWHPQLIRLLCWVLMRYEARNDIIITCGHEDRDYPSVHDTVPLRGFDMRSWVFKDPKAVERDVNENWIYDGRRPSKKCCMFHDVGRGQHLHFQVHDKRTKERDGDR